MSLVNDLLINLEERRGGQRTDKGVFAGLDAADDDLTLREEPRVPDWLRRVIFLLVLGAVFYFIWVLLSSQQSAAIVQANQSPVPVMDTIDTPVIDFTSEAGIQPQLRLESSLMNLPALTSLPLPSAGGKPEVASGSPRLFNVDIDETGQDVILRLDLTAMPSYRHYQLDAPARLVFEFEDTELAQSISESTDSNLIKAIRHNADSANVSDPFRLVFDLATAMTVTDEQIIRDAGNTQLTLKLQPAATQQQTATNTDPSKLPTDLNTAEPEVEIVRKDQVSMQRRPAERVRIKASGYQQALRYYQQANYMQALNSVELHLKSDPDDIQAIHLQALALINSGQLERADKQLYEATRRLPEANELKQLYAHLLMRQNKLADAAAILYISPPTLSDAPDYHALLAAVLQQLGQHAEASSLYADLVQLTPAQSVLWMGLGISLEEMGRVDEALVAYRRALDSGRLSADLTDYVAARIQTLSNRLAESRNS